MILEDLGIPYRILEARRRVGGRLYTYHFPNDFGAPYNYFDVGAMRFPKIPAMNRVFNLFENDNLNTPDIALNSRLTPFYFTGAGNYPPFLSYNGVTVRQNAVPSAITDDVIAPYATALLDDLKNNTKTGWEKMQSVDDHSTRSYMTFKYEPSADLGIKKAPLPTDVVNWCETFDKSTGWYDRAFTETVLEAIAFGWQPGPNPPATQWFCIDGGSQKIADAMATYITKQKPNAITFDARVTAIELTDDETITVTSHGQDRHEFSHVISTIPLPVMRTVDLSKAKLSPMQANALRQLNYGPSVKIGMQFRTAWWTNGKDLDGNILNIVGGQTYTDRPLRTVVYPSFGQVRAGGTTTLIASYCWTEDASRLGALIDHDDRLLAKLVLKELAEIHNIDLQVLSNDLMDIKGWSWSHDPYTMGAFAFFGPGKFKDVYASLNAPASDGRLHFAGEALSVRHAWVEGALDSAWRAVAEMLFKDTEFTDDQRQAFTDHWGENPEWVIESETLVDDEPKRRGPARSPPEVGSHIFKKKQSHLFTHMALVAAYHDKVGSH
ncbi:uncharacterized protein LACBIDRAFT_183317 [Laccaria bicolor S238N-H82]|uniref:Predicted protein n=1 Tax=Laccaria bicolor (strain S238N-H82 / ATCC MYA-4686) TaxID=486041 RepID=B0CZR7_LACBS|nr:uncharacterized protein LACBIDRAFT_183317 [Laccaria bicolor S238N-H82]EDR12198.1 predicted protein [Laccaria bicolor S238N-H82]|eukprot:XP_001876462.1 predicted protein [Laccaria bicolor S238N-H82]